MIWEERQKLLDEYAAASRAFANAVERLQSLNKDIEGFIHALDETGTAHRACERSRIQLDKYMARLRLPSPPAN